MSLWLRTLGVVCVAFILGACNTNASYVPPTQPPNAVTGTITYPTQFALPARAVMNVTLIDLALGAPRVVSESAFPLPAGQPVPFRVQFNPAAIDANLAYFLQARIILDGEVLYTTPADIPVLTRGAPFQVDLTLRSR